MKVSPQGPLGQVCLTETGPERINVRNEFSESILITLYLHLKVVYDNMIIIIIKVIH